MHPESLNVMAQMLGGWNRERQNVLDVGSYDINGSYKPIVESLGWTYSGLDISPGPNVDILASEPFNYPLEDESFDVVISGSTMEHVTAIWLWIPELVRVLKPGGFLAIYTHWKADEHKYPLDCWRIMPDGMRFLFDETGKLKAYSIWCVNDKDIVGTAVKV